jgi:hypothetical protein
LESACNWRCSATGSSVCIRSQLRQTRWESEYVDMDALIEQLLGQDPPV